MAITCDCVITFLIDKQLVRHIVLLTLPLGHDEYTVGVDDRVQPMRNDKHGGVFEALAQFALDQAVSLDVDVRRRLVQHKHLCVAEDCSCQAEQLLLTDGE